LVKSVPGSDHFELIVGITNSPALKPFGFSRVTIGFGDSGAGFDWPATAVRVPLEHGTAMAVSFKGLDRNVLETLAHAPSLRLTQNGRTLGPFTYPRADKAVAALDSCISDQLIAWGADPAQFQAGGRRPVALKDRDNWLSNDSLLFLSRFMTGSGPTRMLQSAFRVTISDRGDIDGCRLILPEGGARLEKEACASVLGQHLFEPPLDPQGKPVRGAASFEIRLTTWGG